MRFFSYLITCMSSQSISQTISVKKDKNTDESKLAWFQDAKFGLFIQWGVSSKLAGE